MLCVPVCFNIKGITDFTIETGLTGSLHDQGDAESLADTIADMTQDRAFSGTHARNTAQNRTPTLARLSGCSELFSNLATIYSCQDQEVGEE